MGIQSSQPPWIIQPRLSNTDRPAPADFRRAVREAQQMVARMVDHTGIRHRVAEFAAPDLWKKPQN
jgi:hypothetical protein